MIIPKEPKLTEAQLKEVTEIVAEFDCKIQVIVGANRSIYAVLGDESHETMINRILGLAYIDRWDAIDSPYRLMDLKSELATHPIKAGSVTLKKEPLFIAGQCTIDPKNPELFLETAHAVKEAGAHMLRGGVWKPRTMPYSFQGDSKSLNILLEARTQTGLPINTEVMDESQLKQVVEAKVDMIQIGTRNALNYGLLRKVGELTAGTNIIVLLKRGRPMTDPDEFIAASEYIAAGGNPNIALCPRGTMPSMVGYRNHPDECITPLLNGKTWAPVIVDPSHSVGRATYVAATSLAAMAYGADGLVIESHISPKNGIGDDPKQSITPDVLKTLLVDARKVWELGQKY